MVTIKNVAEQANVSIATVSRIINGQEGYSEKTMKRVLKAIEELGYTRNALARGLVSSKSHTIAVLLPSVTSRFASELLGGIEADAQRIGQSVIICNTDSNGRRTADYLQMLAEKRVDGIIFVSEWLTEEYERTVERMNVPMVLVATYTSTYPVPYVRIDDEIASYNATEYLLKAGHRSIGMLAGTREDPVAGRPRVEGYKGALKKYGVEPEDRFIAFGDFHYQSGLEAAGDLLEQAPDITAVFAASDEMALGFLSAAHKSGIAVPGDISVIGFDDTLDAQMAIPPLTTVKQPLREMGSTAVELLFAEKPRSIILPHSIVERESVRNID
ncbi:MAG: LacI family DNA-binding transcriptional regulator [Spirochaetia bacterium]